MSVNKVILVGNLGADPECRTTSGGTVVANLRLATSSREKDGENWVDRTEWHRVVCFGKTAENVQRFCQKGKQLYIEGKIRTQKWQDNDGNDRYTTEIVADVVQFLGGGNGSRDSEDREERSNGNRGGGRNREDDRGGSGGGSGRRPPW